MAAKDLQRTIAQLKKQAEELEGSSLPRGIFVKEGQSVDDAAREAKLFPGTRYLPFRWMTEAEWRGHEELEATLLEKTEKADVKTQSDAGADTEPEVDQQPCKLSGNDLEKNGEG